MGVVVTQSIKNTIITCFGFGIGAVNTLFLFTNFMDAEHYGLVSYLLSAANLVWPLMIFGVQNTLVKFFSSYQDSEQQNRFLTLMVILPFCVALFLGGIGLLFYNSILGLFEDKNTIVQPYVWTIFVLAFAISYFEVFFAWSKVKLKSVFGNIMKELFLRICISVLLCLLYFEMITQEHFIYALVLVYLLRTIIMKLYAMKLHRFVPRLVLPDNYKSVFKYSSLILIAGSVASLLIDLDKAMIERYLPIENVANYGMCAYIASVISIPSRAMHQITYPLTAKLINEKANIQLGELYKKSSLNLLITSGLLFVLIVCNVNQLFEIIPEEYTLFIWVVVFIGCTKLFDNLVGNNNSILYNSDYYRIVLSIGIGMSILTVVLNMIFIPTIGTTGAAIATFLSISCYHLIKLWIVYAKFNMFPFSKKTLPSLIIIIGFTFLFYYLEFTFFHPIINIIIKSIFICLAFTLVIYILQISSDINHLIKKFFLDWFNIKI